MQSRPGHIGGVRTDELLPRPSRMRLDCWLLTAVVASACSGGSSSSPIGGSNPPPELVACRARVDSPFQFAEVALRTAQNLGTRRVADRTGTERHARLHADGNRVVFARERSNGDPDSTELFLSTLDGSTAELRLTVNGTYDGWPCWSPTGTHLLFASDRDGTRGLWRAAADGSDPQRWLGAPAGESDDQPDWHRGSGRIAFVRRDGQGVHRVHLANADGTGVFALTDATGAAAPERGDFAPRFAADGARLAFVRRLANGQQQLCVASVATADVEVWHSTAGSIDLPAFAPAGDRLFCGLDEPAAGRSGSRLAWLGAAQATPVLAWPDQRWLLRGIDMVPGLPARPNAAPPLSLPVQDAQLQLGFGSSASGNRQDLASLDGEEVVVRTAASDGRQVGGVNVRFDLPTDDATNVLEVRVQVVARLARSGGDSVLRLSIYNPVDERFDTVVEQLVADGTARQLAFRTDSLRHVTRERQFRLAVIGDVVAGDPTDLAIDLVAVDLVLRTIPN